MAGLRFILITNRKTNRETGDAALLGCPKVCLYLGLNLIITLYLGVARIFLSSDNTGMVSNYPGNS